jgi:hypothetical protein
MFGRLVLIGVIALLFLAGLSTALAVSARRRREARRVRSERVRRSRFSVSDEVQGDA